MQPQRGSLSLTAVHTGPFNLVGNRRDQGRAPQILSQLPWMGGAWLLGGLPGKAGQRGRKEKSVQFHWGITRDTGLHGDQAVVIL